MAVRVVQSAFGKGLVAARDFEAGETVLAEQPGFLLVDGAPVTRPRLLSAVSGALGLPPDAEKSVLLYGGLELWLRSDAAARAVLLQIFSTPDDAAMAEFMLGVVEATGDPADMFPVKEFPTLGERTEGLFGT